MTPARPLLDRLKRRVARAPSPLEGSEAWACLDAPMSPTRLCWGPRSPVRARGGQGRRRRLTGVIATGTERARTASTKAALRARPLALDPEIKAHDGHLETLLGFGVLSPPCERALTLCSQEIVM